MVAKTHISNDIVPISESETTIFIHSVCRGLKDIESGKFYTTDELQDKIKSERAVRTSK